MDARVKPGHARPAWPSRGLALTGPSRNRLQCTWVGWSRWDSSMNQVQVGQKSYRMPPQDGISIAHFLTVADIERSLRFYETVFGGRVVSRGDSKGAPGYIQIANTWLIVNPGGGQPPDKPSVTLSVPADPDFVKN